MVYRICGLCVLVLLLEVAFGQSETERLFWESVDCGDEAQVKLYMEQYPEGAYRDEANECLDGGAASTDAGGSDQDEDLADEVSKRLKICAAHMEAQRLTTGAGGSALACYRDVLEMDSGNVEAVKGLKTIEDTYLDWARRSIENGEYDDAEQYLSKLETLNPEREAVRRLARDLVEARGAGQGDASKKEVSSSEQEAPAAPPQPDLPKLPEGTDLLSASEIRDRVIGNTIAGQPGNLTEHYARNGVIESNLATGLINEWDIDGYRLCRRYLFKVDGCWVLSLDGRKLHVFDAQSGEFEFEAALLEGNAKNL